MKKSFLIIYVICGSILLSSCDRQAANNASNVFDVTQINKRQELKKVNILSITPGKVKVKNTENKKRAKIVGALIGGASGLALTSRNQSVLGTIIGGLGGSGVGSLLARDTVLVNGVSVIYQQDDGRILTSIQVGNPCDFAPGSALVVVTGENSTRIQSNHSCVLGMEHVIGKSSNLLDVFTDLDIHAEDQDTLDSLKRQSNLKRRETDLKRSQTELKKEKRRYDRADDSVDMQFEEDQLGNY